MQIRIFNLKKLRDASKKSAGRMIYVNKNVHDVCGNLLLMPPLSPVDLPKVLHTIFQLL
jgi:hypothetical protein